MKSTYRALIATALFAGAFISGANANQNRTSEDNRDVKSGQSVESASSRVMLTSVDDLLGKKIVGSDGEDLGQIEHVMIRTDTGQIRYVLVETDLADGAKFVALPWSAIRATVRDDKVRISGDRSTISNAPRVSGDRLNETLLPDRVNEIDTYWLSVPESMSSDKSPRIDNKRGAKASSSSSTLKKERSSVKDKRDDDDDRRESAIDYIRPMDGDDDEDNLNDSARPSREQKPTSASEQAAARYDVLIGRTSMRTINSGSIADAETLEGRKVHNPDGDVVGKISQLIVDVSSGHIAYLVIERGGFLGVGAESFPVPFDEISWSRNRLTMTADESLLKKYKGLNSDEIPNMVDRSDLDTLFRHYGASPYWRSAESG